MTNHLANIRTKRKPSTKSSKAAVKASERRIRIAQTVAEGQLPKNSWLAWVEITQRAVLVPVIRWIE